MNSSQKSLTEGLLSQQFSLTIEKCSSVDLKRSSEIHMRKLLSENVKLRKKLADLSRRQAELEALVETDEMTGVLNRRGISRFLCRAIAHAKRHYSENSSEICVLFCDLDRFKWVNDQYGHALGDALLKNVAQCFADKVRGDDAVGRVGGDEFVVIIWNIKLKDILAKIELLEREVASVAAAQGIAGSLGISIGMTRIRGDDTPESAMLRADHSMYAIKRWRSESRNPEEAASFLRESILSQSTANDHEFEIPFAAQAVDTQR